MVGFNELSLPVRGDKFRIQLVEGGSGDSLLYFHGEDGIRYIAGSIWSEENATA